MENSIKPLENSQNLPLVKADSTIQCECYLLNDFSDEMRQLPMHQRYDVEIQKGYVIPSERKTKFVAKDIVKKNST